MKVFITNRILANQQVVMEALKLSLDLQTIGVSSYPGKHIVGQLSEAIEQTTKIRQLALEDEPIHPCIKIQPNNEKP